MTGSARLSTDLNLFRRLFAETRSYRLQIACIFVISMLAAPLALLTPVLVSMAFKVQQITATPEEATAQLGLIMGAGLFLSVALAGAVLVYRTKGVK